MRYWWVNQNQTYKHEVKGGFLWSPKTNRDGRKNRFYDNMTEASPGDLVLSFCDTEIKAIGVVQDSAISAEKPNFGTVGDQWDNEGWLVLIEFEELKTVVRPKDFISELVPHFFGKYDPLQPNGNGNQGVYLAEVSLPFLEVVLSKCGRTKDEFLTDTGTETEDRVALDALAGRTDIGETQKLILALARRGQGVFRANVRLNESACRITKVHDPKLLVASHIKPWAKCADNERLDGCNGLLLSPHIDPLFDRGYISFDDEGNLMRSSEVDPSVFVAWGIADDTNVGQFSPSQTVYLAYHRKRVFKP